MTTEDRQFWEPLPLPAIIWRILFFLTSLLVLFYIGLTPPV